MTAYETRDVLLTELQLIEKWVQDQQDLWFWEKLGRMPFMLLDKMTPKAVRNKIGQALDELGSYIQTGGRYLFSVQSVLRLLDQAASEMNVEVPVLAKVPDAGKLPLEVMDRAAMKLSESRQNMAALQGATTGFGGIFTLAVDIPALLGLSLKVLQETAVCYGFDPNDPRERVFIVKCLQFSSADIVGKRAVLEELTSFDQVHAGGRVVSQLQGWREVVTTYRDNFGWKKLFQLVPVAGMVFGAFINKGTVNDVAEAGRMLYRKRRILKRLDETENTDQER